MFLIDETNKKQHCYVTYGRQFLRYRWFKPIIAIIVFAILYLCLAVGMVVGVATYGQAATGQTFQEILSNMSTSYDDFNVNTLVQSVLNLGQLAMMIPALFLTALIVRDRPFSSYSSSRGGWSWKIFFRCLGICVFVVVIPIVVYTYIDEGFNTLNIKFTLAGFIGLLLLGPLQCIAEEYVFRGLLMQTLGSWVRIPIIAVFLQAVIFAASHPYNWIGKAAILVSGMGFGLSAWIGRGIETSSAIHIANNMTAFIMMGLGITTLSSDITVNGLIFDICMYTAYVIIMLIISKKTDWFNTARKDDLGKANAKEEARRARKAAKNARKKGLPVETPAGGIDFTSMQASEGIDFTSGNPQPVKTDAVKEVAPVTDLFPSAYKQAEEPAVEANYEIPEEPATERVGRVARNQGKY